MTRQKIIVLLVVMIFQLVGCTSKENNKEVLVMLKTLTNPFFKSIDEGVRDAAKIDTTHIIVTRAGTTESDADFQVKELNNNVHRSSISCLIITPSNPIQIAPQLVGYNTNNIPIVIVDTPIPEELTKKYNLKYKAVIYSDNKLGGTKAAEFALTKIKKPLNQIKFLILGGVSSHTSSIDRVEGYMEVLKKKQVPETNIYIRYADWRKEKAYNTVYSLITGKNSFDIILAANDNMAIGAFEAYNTTSINPLPVIVGFDSIDEVKKYIKNAQIKATIEQVPYEMGKRAFSSCTDTQEGIQKIDIKLIDTVK